MNDNLNALPIGTELNHYVIEAVLGSGGFGIVYKAHHAHLDEQVVIKEFLPVELAGRHGNTVAPHGTSKQEVYSECLRRFMEEGRTLVKLRHPNVVRCRDLFTANGTAYLVMDFEDGLPLDELVRSLEAQGSRYTEQQLLHFLLPLADGLAYIHSQGVLHRDIKPANVFIRRSDGSPVIIDFGAAKQNFALASQSQAPFTEFYAPLEQIEGGGEAKPTVDIHAFGGLMYRLATGQMGPKAEARAMALVYDKPDPLQKASELAEGHYSQHFLATIDQCLAFKASERPQTMADVKQRLVQDSALEAVGPSANAGKSKRSKATPELSDLDDLITLAGVDGVISEGEMTMLLDKATYLGIDTLDAGKYIKHVANKRNWTLDTAKPPASNKPNQRKIDLSTVMSATEQQLRLYEENYLKSFPKIYFICQFVIAVALYNLPDLLFTLLFAAISFVGSFLLSHIVSITFFAGWSNAKHYEQYYSAYKDNRKKFTSALYKVWGFGVLLFIATNFIAQYAADYV